jgi:hypothetical protein
MALPLVWWLSISRLVCDISNQEFGSACRNTEFRKDIYDWRPSKTHNTNMDADDAYRCRFGGDVSNPAFGRAHRSTDFRMNTYVWRQSQNHSTDMDVDASCLAPPKKTAVTKLPYRSVLCSKRQRTTVSSLAWTMQDVDLEDAIHLGSKKQRIETSS